VSEWWTYRPSDFLMFSPRIYWRLFQSLNAAWWPAQIIVLAAATSWIGWIGLAGSKARADIGLALRAAAALLGACWLVVAWAFLLQRFAPINWVASGFAVAFILQGLGWLVLALLGDLRGHSGVVRWRAGIALGLWALLGHALLGSVFGRPWQQAEVFGLAPDPTAIGSLAFLLLVQADGPKRWLLRTLWIVPLGWCAISAATLATMGSAQAAFVLAAAVLAAVAANWPRARLGGSTRA
jgi:hypothetical protein